MYNPLLLPDLREMLEENDTRALTEFCEVLYPAVVAEVLEGLDSEQVWTVLGNCQFERRAEIFGFLSLPQQVELVKNVNRQQLSKLLEAMSPDDRVDLLGRLDSDLVDDLLPLIAQAERADIRKLLSYPDDSAGSIMTTDYASLPGDITVREALDRLRQQAPDRETIYYVYIIDDGRHLHGLVSLRQLILAKPGSRLEDIMRRDVVSVRVDDDQEQVANQLGRYDFLAIPVVDNQNRLVGIITHDDALDVMQAEATEDAHLLAAVSPLEDSYLTTPLLTLLWKRGVWLVLLLGTALLTATVLRGYEHISQKQNWMVLFIPLVLASGGNAGSQSATLVIRMVALGEIGRRETLRIAGRELLLAMMLGGGLMLLGFVAAWQFVSVEKALVVSLTVFLVVIVGAFTGAMLPLGFKRAGMDPALMSNPLIAALVDITGVVIYFTIAAVILQMTH